MDSRNRHQLYHSLLIQNKLLTIWSINLFKTIFRFKAKQYCLYMFVWFLLRLPVLVLYLRSKNWKIEINKEPLWNLTYDTQIILPKVYSLRNNWTCKIFFRWIFCDLVDIIQSIFFLRCPWVMAIFSQRNAFCNYINLWNFKSPRHDFINKTK